MRAMAFVGTVAGSVVVGVIALVVWNMNMARMAPPAPYTPPTLKTPFPERIRVGEPIGMPLGDEDGTFSDTDKDGEGDPLKDGVQLLRAVVIDECGGTQYFGGQDIGGWAPPAPGEYTIILTIDDKPCEDCADDPENNIEITIEVEPWDGDDAPPPDRTDSDQAPKAGCSTCGGSVNDLQRRIGDGDISLGSLLMRFSMGPANDADLTGVLYVDAEEPNALLATPKALRFGGAAGGVNVITDANGLMLQARSAAGLADVEVLGAYKYQIRFFDSNDVGALSGTYPVTYADAFRSWIVDNPDGGSGINRLRVTEQILSGASLTDRAVYLFEHDPNDLSWTLTTIDPDGNDVVQTEVVRWEAMSNDPNGNPRKRRIYKASDSAGERACRVEEHTGLPPWDPNDPVIWRRTRLVVDPNGADLATTWTWSNVAHGALTRQSEQRPYGGWTWTNHIDEPNGDLTIERISGFKDQAFISDPSPAASGVRTITTEYVRDGLPLEIAALRETIGGDLVRSETYAVTYSSSRPSAIVRHQAGVDPNTAFTATYTFSDAFGYRPADVTFPDGRLEDGEHYPQVVLTLGTLPGTPHSHATAGSGRFRKTETTHTSTSQSLVANKSTKDVSITDKLTNLSWLDERYVWDGSAWQRISWTSRIFDKLGRLTGEYHSNGQYHEYSYSLCCGETMTDELGVQTQIERDLLGRPTAVRRLAVAAAGGYPAQPEVETTFDYSTQHRVTRTVAASTLSEDTVTDFDGAGRVIGVTTGAGADKLKTIYAYATGSGGGLLMKTYDAYASAATAGTAGVRERLTDHYRDGQMKSVTGSATVGRYYDYGTGTNESWSQTVTGPSSGSARYQKTYADLAGRTKRVERPGWTASGTAPLTTSYRYDPNTAQLLRVEDDPNQDVDTLYAYDEMGRVSQTATDINGNGAIDLAGPDRVSSTSATIELLDSAWWQVSKSYAYPDTSSATAKLTSETRNRLTGFTGGLIGETRSYDVAGNLTISTVTIDANDLVTRSSDMPGTTQDELSVTHAGRLVEMTSSTGVVSSYTYDALGRQTVRTDGRGNDLITAYDTSGRTSSVTDESGAVTNYAYYTTADSGAGAYPGRLKYEENDAGKRTYFAYSDRGETTRTWGHVPYPTEMVYDSFGQRTTLRTYRDPMTDWPGSTWPVSTGDADETTWTFDEATGLVEAKTYADTTAVSYTYTVDGQLETRQWARHDPNQVTEYAYDGVTRELLEVDYAAALATTDIEYTYDRMGRRKTVSDAAGTRTFVYNPLNMAEATETFDTGGFAGLVLTHGYDDANATYPGRFAALKVGTAMDDDRDYLAEYSYDALGRLSRVQGPGLPTGGSSGAYYEYLAGAGGSNTDMVERLTIKDSGGDVLAWTKRVYDSDRDLLASIENAFGDLSSYTTISKYAYENDNRARRTSVVRTGTAFAADNLELWQYNDRNEIISSDPHLGTNPSSPGTAIDRLDRRYAYDPIGNRVSSINGDPLDPNNPGVELEYSANELNQYSRIDVVGGGSIGQGLEHDPDGNLYKKYTLGDFDHDGFVSLGDYAGFLGAYGDCVEDPNTGYHLDYDLNNNGCLDGGDLAGILSIYGTRTGGEKFTWNGENRLVSWEPLMPLPGEVKLTYAYDYMGRRIEEKTYEWDPNANGGQGDWEPNAASHTRFSYSHWLTLLETDALASGTTIRSLSWGADLAGSSGGASRASGDAGHGVSVSVLSNAGGIGGLLASIDDSGPNSLSHTHAYDERGNLVQSIDYAASDANDALTYAYEFDAFGNIVGPDLDADGGWRDDAAEAATRFPWRFQTKRWADAANLGYWGYRYYDPVSGRWSRRDPINEDGGENLYGYVQNAPLVHVDAIGLDSIIFHCTSDVVGSSGSGVHCDVECVSRSGKVNIGGSGPAHPGPGPHPRIDIPPGTPEGTTIPRGGCTVDDGTCKLLIQNRHLYNQLGNRLRYNAIDSNSNSALWCLLKMSGVDCKPDGPTPVGWGSRPKFDCSPLDFCELFCKRASCGS